MNRLIFFYTLFYFLFQYIYNIFFVFQAEDGIRDLDG